MRDLARYIRNRIGAVARSRGPANSAPAEGRVPPGQRVVKNFPVLDLGERPAIQPEAWTLEVSGCVEQPLLLDWAAFRALPETSLTADIHCVTRWSRLDVPWVGVAVRTVLAQARPLAEARYVTLHSHDGYTSNLPLEAVLEAEALLAYRVDGKPLRREHGGPVRLVVPSRYFWKSAKWIRGIELHAEDRPGFWETRGYHNQGDPWKEERYRGQ